MEDIDSFLTMVDEFVDDENKIVTCKWLSRQLVLHVNQARKILEAYVDGQKKNENGINIVYTLIGRDSNGMCVKVVRDSDLDAAKSKLKKVLSVTIYSIQKSKLQDSAILYAADYDSNRENLHENSRFGGISYSGATRLSKDEIKQRTSKPAGEVQGDPAAMSSSRKTSAVTAKNKTPQQKANFFGKIKTSPPAEKKEEPTKPKDKPPENKESPPAKKQKKTTGMDAFMAKGKTDLFGKSETKTKQTVKKEPEKEVKEPEKNTKEPKSKKRKEEKPKKSPEPDIDEDLRIDDFPIDDDDFLTDKKKKPVPKPNSKSDAKSNLKDSKEVAKPKNHPKPNKDSKKSRRKDSNELPAKKRRRIQAMSSSSEDEDEEEEMDIIPPSPPPVTEPVKEKRAVKKEKVDSDLSNGQKNRRKKKVLKTKTYMDEDGCMVTEKIYEYESCSSDDENTVVNGNKKAPTEELEEKKKLPAVSTAQPKKQTKQASIMGFFKKK